ncbi:hypothetical protein NLI96_g4729 [Meripilus lineatus]|uniref:RTA1-domain-containing protein n=1 Tax=Meripilus lineatus TaxID=2056292 RepID=A0AAD5V4F6_9APHY|nr:hypothetical protein NLI96_g4729 [Physisporinus lineatus]
MSESIVTLIPPPHLLAVAEGNTSGRKAQRSSLPALGSFGPSANNPADGVSIAGTECEPGAVLRNHKCQVPGSFRMLQNYRSQLRLITIALFSSFASPYLMADRAIKPSSKLIGTRTLICNVLLLLAAASSAYAKDLPPRPADPYADPKNDIYNPLRYIATNSLTAVAFTLVLLTGFAQTWLTWRVGGRFMLAMVVALYTFAVGLGLRFGLHADPESKPIYIAEYLFVVLSPCGFIAAEYVLLGRLSTWLKADEYLLIPPKRITPVFVASDVITFLIQAAGGSVSVSNNPSTALAGSRIFLVGLALQLVSFILFSILYIVFLYRVYTLEPKKWTQDHSLVWYADWRSLAGALCLSCVGILIRSVYRTVELAQGYHGTLATTEAYFYALDTLPLFLATVIYIPFWPGRYIPSYPGAQKSDVESYEFAGRGKNSMTDSDGRQTEEYNGRAT